MIRQEQQRADCEAGLARNRKKRKFGEDDTPTATDFSSFNTVSTTDSPDSSPTDFCHYAANLIQRAEISGGGDNVCPSITTIPPSSNLPHPTNSASSSRKTQIPLENLFNYSLDPEEGLEFYWPGSKKNLEADLLVHEHALANKLSDSEMVPNPVVPI